MTAARRPLIILVLFLIAAPPASGEARLRLRTALLLVACTAPLAQLASYTNRRWQEQAYLSASLKATDSPDKVRQVLREQLPMLLSNHGHWLRLDRAIELALDPERSKGGDAELVQLRSTLVQHLKEFGAEVTETQDGKWTIVLPDKFSTSETEALWLDTLGTLWNQRNLYASREGWPTHSEQLIQFFIYIDWYPNSSRISVRSAD